MASQAPKILYGIHSISPRRISDSLPYGLLKVIGSATLALSADLEQLYAGSNKYAWAAESKTISTDLSAKVKAYPGFLFSLFLGATVTEVSTDAAGTVSTPVNVKGTSIMAATGLATIAVKAASKANLKFGKYVIKALTSTTLGVYLISDIDISRGTDAVYADDTLLLTLTTITISTTTGTDVTDLGLTLTGGASATAFVVGDTAEFSVSPPSDYSSEIVVGKSTDTLPNFSALLLSQKRATGEMFEIDAHNCVGGGLPINMEEQTFSEADLKMTCLYSAPKDRVFTIRTIKPTE